MILALSSSKFDLSRRRRAISFPHTHHSSSKLVSRDTSPKSEPVFRKTSLKSLKTMTNTPPLQSQLFSTQPRLNYKKTNTITMSPSPFNPNSNIKPPIKAGHHASERIQKLLRRSLTPNRQALGFPKCTRPPAWKKWHITTITIRPFSVKITRYRQRVNLSTRFRSNRMHLRRVRLAYQRFPSHKKAKIHQSIRHKWLVNQLHSQLA